MGNRVILLSAGNRPWPRFLHPCRNDEEPRRQQQGAFLVAQLAEAGDLPGLLRRHRQALPPFHHVEHALGGVGEVLHILRRQPQPRPVFAPHFGDLDDIGGQQRIGGDQMALVGEDDGGPPLVLATLHQGMDVVHQADVGHRQLVLVAVLGKHPHLENGHVGIGPELAGAVEEMRCEAARRAEMPQGIGHEAVTEFPTPFHDPKIPPADQAEARGDRNGLRRHGPESISAQPTRPK